LPAPPPGPAAARRRRPFVERRSTAKLDVFASAAPFGAAALDGVAPFEAPIVEANPALVAITGGRAAPASASATCSTPRA
jgi:two-component system cell cycle sensor histidine kinase/response regulator CckA